MYTKINNIEINFNFNPHPFVDINGPDDLYLVEIKEFHKHDDLPRFVESYPITSKPRKYTTPEKFNFDVEFYMDFEITISEFVNGFGIREVFKHKYNDYQKYVRFNFDSTDYEECLLWSERVKIYQKKFGCFPIIFSNFEDINKIYDEYFLIKNDPNFEFYKTYNVGRYAKTSTDFRTIDPRKEGFIWFGNWKVFWSYQHPREWKTLTSQEIIDDILGL